MGTHSRRGACPSRSNLMISLGMFISVCGFLLCAATLARGISRGNFKFFPVFYSYLIYVLAGTGIMYGFLAFDRNAYPSAFWYYYLITILVEFSVLIEISDHIFRPFPAIRQLGRALTITVSCLFAIFYVIPSIVHADNRQVAFLDFTLRSSATKLGVILAILLACQHFRLKLGKTIGGLVLGFAIFQGVNVANHAAAKAFPEAVYGRVFWLMGPTATLLCVFVWLVTLWNYLPERSEQAAAHEDGFATIPLELARLNSEVTKYLER